jgi:hypothetical protein
MPCCASRASFRAGSGHDFFTLSPGRFATLAEIDPFLTEIGGVDDEALGFEHQLNRLRSGAIVFNNQ